MRHPFSGQECHRSIFEGEPYVRQMRDELGQAVYEVMICELTPERVRTARALASLTLTLFIVLTFFTANILLIYASLFLTLSHHWFTQLFANKLSVRIDVRITPTEFKVRRGQYWDVYDRTIRHRFVLLTHNKTREEQDHHEFITAKAQMRREVVRPMRIYGDSFHVVFEHFGQRRDIIAVYGKQRAEAVLARLQAVDDLMDGMSGMGNAPTSPADQWTNSEGDGRQAGDLP